MTSAFAGSRAQLAMAMAAWAQQRESLLCNSAISRPRAHVSMTEEKSSSIMEEKGGGSWYLEQMGRLRIACDRRCCRLHLRLQD